MSMEEEKRPFFDGDDGGESRSGTQATDQRSRKSYTHRRTLAVSIGANAVLLVVCLLLSLALFASRKESRIDDDGRPSIAEPYCM